MNAEPGVISGGKDPAEGCSALLRCANSPPTERTALGQVGKQEPVSIRATREWFLPRRSFSLSRAAEWMSNPDEDKRLTSQGSSVCLRVFLESQPRCTPKDNAFPLSCFLMPSFPSPVKTLFSPKNLKILCSVSELWESDSQTRKAIKTF